MACVSYFSLCVLKVKMKRLWVLPETVPQESVTAAGPLWCSGMPGDTWNSDMLPVILNLCGALGAVSVRPVKIGVGCALDVQAMCKVQVASCPLINSGAQFSQSKSRFFFF